MNRSGPLRVSVIGGGISGLAAAYRIQEISREKNIPVELKLYEASSRLGGVISTVHQDGCLMEGGPDSFISEKPWALDLCKRLGLEDEIIGTNPQFRKSFIVKDGRLIPVPEGFYLMAPLKFGPFLASPLFSWPAKMRMGMEYFIPAAPRNGDESVAGFIRRRFGTEAFERAGQAMISGIYSADPEKLSLGATFPRFLEMEREHGSVIRGLLSARAKSSKAASGPRYSLFLSLRNGMQKLTDTLASRLAPGVIRLNTPVAAIDREGVDAVILSVSAPMAAQLLSGFSRELAEELALIPYASVATLNLIYRREDISHPLDGFGFVVPAKEKMPLIGCTFSSVKFPGRVPEGRVLLRAFMSGENSSEDTIIHSIGKLLGITGPPVSSFLSRHPSSMPQYHVGHLEHAARIESLLQKFPGLYLTGNAFSGIGIPDCIHHAELTAERIMSCHSEGGARRISDTSPACR